MEEESKKEAEKKSGQQPSLPENIKMEFDEFGVQILINEYNLCNERIESFQRRQDSILQISMAIVGGAVAFTLVNKIAEELYIVISIIPVIIFVQIAYHYTRVIANQGYREYLEEKLNNLLPNDSAIKYTSIGKQYLLNTNPMAKFNSIIFPIIILLAISYSIIMSNFNIFVLLLNLLLAIGLVFMALTYSNFSNKLNEKVKEFCEKN